MPYHRGVLGGPPRTLLRDVWSPEDQDDLDLFLDAVAGGRLSQALEAIEGTDASTRQADEAQLSAWAAVLAQRAARQSARSAFQTARLLKGLLGEELGFAGDRETYYDSRNGCLHQVIERRRGLPILLSAVFVEVGRRAGLAMEGVGLPRHFIARVGGPNGVLIDPFAGGAEMSRDGCRRLLHELSEGTVEWSDDFLRASSTEEFVERVLTNLVYTTQREGDVAGLYRVVTFLGALTPASPERRLQRGAAAEMLGAWDEAAGAYREVLEEFPDSGEAETAARKLEELAGRALVN